MTKEEANAKIKELTDEAMKKVREAQKIADETNVCFSFSVAYGMGGWYDPENKRDNAYYEDEDNEAGWNPSSQSC